MGGAVTVRRATAADADAIARVHVTAWQVGYRGLVDDAYLDGLDIAEWAARTRMHLATPGQAKEWLVAEASGQIIGFTSYGPYRTARAPDQPGSPADGEVHAIYLCPDHWGTGAGRALMDAAVDRLTTRGLTPVRLWTPTENTRARRFYERYGFTADAEGEFRLPYSDGEIILPIVRYTRCR